MQNTINIKQNCKIIHLIWRGNFRLHDVKEIKMKKLENRCGNSLCQYFNCFKQEI